MSAAGLLGTPLALALVWARPWGFAFLLLPLVLWLVSRRPEKPPLLPTGTLSVWQAVAAADAARAARRTRHWTWSEAAVLAALVAGSLAMAGPRARSTAAPQTWTLVLDRSPSMELALTPGVEETRGERAMALAGDWLGRHARSDDRVRWVAAERAPIELAPNERPPVDWTRAARREGGGEPDWPAYDRPDVLWVGDRAPEPLPRAASWVASGGAEVPGPVAVGPDGVFGVTAGRLEPLSFDRGAIALVEAPEESLLLPPLLESLVRAWARTRGIERVLAGAEGRRAASQAEDLRLVVAAGPAGAGASSSVAFRAAGAGFDWQGTARPSAPDDEAQDEAQDGAQDGAQHEAEDKSDATGGASLAPVAPWAVGQGERGEALDLVLSAPGRFEVRVAWLAAPRGDPAAFALAFASALDGALLPPAGVVSLAERAAAGTGGEHTALLLARALEEPADPRHPNALDAWLAGAAAALLWLARSLRR